MELYLERYGPIVSVPADFNYSEGGEIAYYTELWNNTRRMYRVALNNLNLKGYDIQIGVTGETQHIDLWTDKTADSSPTTGKAHMSISMPTVH